MSHKNKKGTVKYLRINGQRVRVEFDRNEFKEDVDKAKRMIKDAAKDAVEALHPDELKLKAGILVAQAKGYILGKIAKRAGLEADLS